MGNGPTALIWSSEHGHEKVVRMLFGRGANPNAQGRRYGDALLDASASGHEKMVQMRLKKASKKRKL